MDRAVQQGGRELSTAAFPLAAAVPAHGARRRPPLAAEWQLALPLAGFFCLFFLAPLALLVFVSAHADNDLTTTAAVQYRRFAGDPFNWRVVLNTLLLGVKTVGLTACLAYPLALCYFDLSPRWQRRLIFAIILPLLTGTVVRTFAWVVILGNEGLVNTAIVELGLSPVPIQLIHTEFGLVLSLSQIEMPIMLLPLLSVLHRLDRNLVDVSLSLGAGHWRTFARIILPLAMPGLVAGCMLVFASSVTAYFSQTIIGGARLVYLPKFVYEQAMVLFDWPFAAALATVLMLSVLAAIGVLAAAGRRLARADA
jgi:putative spermidine/putrescine transport system permease protein